MHKPGTVIRWDATRTFGFIRGEDATADVFFHIRDYRGDTPPQVGLKVGYEEIHIGGKGPRAIAVRPIQEPTGALRGRANSDPDRSRRVHAVASGPGAGQAASKPRRSAAPTGFRPGNRAIQPPRGASLAFALMLGWAAVLAWALWRQYLPLGVLAALVAVNLATLWFYGADKHAARTGSWRVSENRLHLFSLLGGWPAAWLAQQNMRHKSSKASFRRLYWGTIVLHCAALLAYLHWVGALSAWLH